MILSLRYNDLSGTISESNKLAKELGQYCDDLSRKVQRNMYSVEGGMSSTLNNADYFVNAKINQLRARDNNACELSNKTQTLLDTAKRVDTDVERTIQANQKSFFNKNPDLKSSKVKLALTSFLCDMKQVPILGSIIKGGEEVLGAFDQLQKDIRYWYKCGGGEQLLTNVWDIVVKIDAAVAAVALFVAAIVTGAGLVVLIAYGILAIIAVVNAITNVGTSIKAIQAGAGHPAMSKIYSNRDTLAQVLREENFHNGFLNRLSNMAAMGIEALEVICNVVVIVDAVLNVAKNWTRIKESIRKSIDLTFRNRNVLGQVQSGHSLWNGVKAMTTKVYKGIPKIINDGFKPAIKAIIKGKFNISTIKTIAFDGIKNVMKTYKWFRHPSQIIQDGKDLVNGIQELTDVYRNYERGKAFFNLPKINDIRIPNINMRIPNIVIAPPGMCLPLKFEYIYPYYEVSFAKAA